MHDDTLGGRETPMRRLRGKQSLWEQSPGALLLPVARCGGRPPCRNTPRLRHAQKTGLLTEAADGRTHQL